MPEDLEPSVDQKRQMIQKRIEQYKQQRYNTVLEIHSQEAQEYEKTRTEQGQIITKDQMVNKLKNQKKNLTRSIRAMQEQLEKLPEPEEETDEPDEEPEDGPLEAVE